MAWDDVVSREFAWLGSDPPGQGTPRPWTLSPPPPLQGPTGPLDFVSAYYRSPIQRARALYITRVRSTTDALTEGAAEYEWRHVIVLTLTWSFETSTGQLDTESQAYETALAAIEQRIRGPIQDKSHGGQFCAAAVEQGRTGIEIVIGNGRPDALYQAYTSGELLEATITYPVFDVFIS